MYPYFLFAAIHHPKSSPTFSVRPCSSVGGVTVDLIRRSWVRFPPRSKDFLCLVWFPVSLNLLGLTPSGLFMGLSSTLIYTSELILLPHLESFTWQNATSADRVTLYLADRATRLGGLPHLSCKHDQIKMRDYMERRVGGLPHLPGVPHLYVNRP